MSYYNYVEQMKDVFKRRLENGNTKFTHLEIREITNTNCPYSVLKCLKKYFEFSYEDKAREVIKKDLKGNQIKVMTRYREYTVLKKRTS